MNGITANMVLVFAKTPCPIPNCKFTARTRQVLRTHISRYHLDDEGEIFLKKNKASLNGKKWTKRNK